MSYHATSLDQIADEFERLAKNTLPSRLRMLVEGEKLGLSRAAAMLRATTLKLPEVTAMREALQGLLAATDSPLTNAVDRKNQWVRAITKARDAVALATETTDE